MLGYKCEVLSNITVSYYDLLNMRFEASYNEACMRTPADPDDCLTTLAVADVSKTFKQVNIHKAAGQADYQDVYSKNVLTNWQVSSLTISTSPWPSL